MRRFAAFLPVLAILFLPAILAGQAGQDEDSPFPASQPRMRGSNQQYDVTGTLRDESNSRPLDGIRVDLRTASGNVLMTTITNQSGEFTFENVRIGSYFIVVDEASYQRVNRPLFVSGPVVGLDISLRPYKSGEAPSKNPTVSARELSIPRKAHDSMQKGLMLLYQKSDYRGSLAQFERAIKEYPDYYEAYAQMSIAYMNLSDATEAEKALRKSIEISKESYADSYYLLASVFAGGQRFAEAETAARKATELDPTSWQANFELAHALYELKRYPEAEKSALVSVDLKPDNLTALLLTAEIHGQMGNARAVLHDLNAYLKIAPPGPAADHARAARDQLQQGLAASPQPDATGDEKKPFLQHDSP